MDWPGTFPPPEDESADEDVEDMEAPVKVLIGRSTDKLIEVVRMENDRLKRLDQRRLISVWQLL
jgi:hypothetical protein